MSTQKFVPGWNPRQPKTAPATKDRLAHLYLDPDRFDSLIKAQGMRVRVYRSVLCPRIKSIDSAEHEIDCSLCNGNNYVDFDPIDTYAFIQAQTFSAAHLVEGEYDANVIAATFVTGIELTYYTLVEICDQTGIFEQPVKRSPGQTDVLKYKACKVNVVLDQFGKQYLQGSDFVLDANGSLFWQAGRGPATGTIYSIHYECPIQFRATKAMHVHRFVQMPVTATAGEVAFRKAPAQWMLQRAFLVKRKDRLTGAPMPLNPINDPSDSE